MAENEANVISHLLNVEAQASDLVKEAQDEADKRLSSAHAKADAEFKEKFSRAVAELEKNYSEKLSFKFDSEYNAKVIFENVSGIHEYLFCYLLALIDFDILLIQCEKDIDSAAERLHLSSSFVMGEKREFHINAYDCRKFPDKTSSNIVNGSSENKIKIILPERPMSKRNNIHNFSNNKGQGLRCERSIEELAKSASSVVLIAKHTQKNNRYNQSIINNFQFPQISCKPLSTT